MVLASMLVVVALTATVDLVFSLADELDDVSATYTSWHALLFVLRIAPTGIYELLPFSALSGAIIGLGVLASNQELVVIRAAGVSTGRVVWSAMQPTLVVMVGSLLIGEFVAPPLQQLAQSQRALQQSGSSVMGGGVGSWQKVGDEFIHINAIAPEGEQLFGVTRYRVDPERQLLSSSFAARADYVREGEDNHWRLVDVVETVLTPASTAVQEWEELRWPVQLSPELLSVLLVPPERQSITGLYRFARYFQAEGLESGRYYLAFWKKVLQPLATAALVLLAISFVFGPLREATTGARIFAAIGTGLAFTIVQRLLEPTSLLLGFDPLIAVLVPIAVCALLGLLLLRRVR